MAFVAHSKHLSTRLIQMVIARVADMLRILLGASTPKVKNLDPRWGRVGACTNSTYHVFSSRTAVRT